jgi:hypothetical protein
MSTMICERCRKGFGRIETYVIRPVPGPDGVLIGIYLHIACAAQASRARVVAEIDATADMDAVKARIREQTGGAR